jgi:drug/metabolite transporter (DMT)-like permease
MIFAAAAPASRIAIWMAISAIFFGLLVGLVRHVGQDMDIFVISFWRFVFAFLMFMPWIYKVGFAGMRTNHLGMHTLRTCCLIVSSVTLLTAVTIMPLDEVTAISFTTPLFAVIGAMLFLKEQAGPRRWAALIIGFVGMLIILRPGIEIFEFGALLVILSALTFAGVVLYGKVLSAIDTPEQLVFYLALIAVPLSFLPALFFWQWPNGEQFMFLILIAVCSNGNMYGIAQALKAGDASATQPYDFLRLPTTAFVGWFAFGEISDIYTWIGAAVIFASTIYITHREAKKRKLAD